MQGCRKPVRVVDWLQEAARLSAVAKEQAGWEGQAPIRPEEETQQRELAARVRSALMAIPERDAKLLILSDAGFDYRELAQIVQVAPGSIGTLLARARKSFARAYGIDEPEMGSKASPMESGVGEE